MKPADMRPFAVTLKTWRQANGLTQSDVASELGISRKTYLLLETCRWLPQSRERAHFMTRLHELHTPAAKALADVMGASLEDYVQTSPAAPADAAVPLDAKHAKLVFDSAVLGVAEHLDMSPRALRPIVAALLERLAAAGMPMAQAAALAKGEAAKKA